MRFPYMTMPNNVKVTPKLINPQATNIFVKPLCSIQGLMANGMPILKAFLRKATPVNASPVICSQLVLIDS